MKTPGWLGLVAAAFLLVGVVFGLAPVKSDGYDCGSAFIESDVEVQELTDVMSGGQGASGCDEARSSRQPIAGAAIGIAALLGVAAWVVMGSSSKPSAAA